MALIYLVPVRQTTRVAAGRAAAGATLAVNDGNKLGTVWPQNLVILRGDGVLTILVATARTGNAITITGATEGYADAAQVAGDGVAIEPTASGPGGVVMAMLNVLGSGTLALPVLADAAAPSSSIFFGSDHLDGATVGAPHLCRKDAAGNVSVVTDSTP